MRRFARLPVSLVPLAAQARWQSSNEKPNAAGSNDAKPPKPEGAEVPAESSSAARPPANTPAKSGEQGDYHFPANEVLDAVKKRDFNTVQTHASKLVQSQWKEAYNVPAACIVIFVVMWYWIAWSRRSIRRKCEAMVASTKQQTEEMVDVVRNMTEKWKTDMAKANQQMQGIIDKNSELTRDIDRMTTALRSCSIRPTAASAAAATPTVAAVRRAAPAAPVTDDVVVETAEAAEAPSTPAEKAESKE